MNATTTTTGTFRPAATAAEILSGVPMKPFSLRNKKTQVIPIAFGVDDEVSQIAVRPTVQAPRFDTSGVMV